MARIAGIQIEKDSKGRPAYARFDLKKHPEALELLNKIGALEPDADWNEGITPDQFMEEVSHILKTKFNER
jgi:hypothetical protein